MKKQKQRLTDKFIFKQTAYKGKKCGLYIRVSSDEFVKNAKGEKEKRASVQTQIDDAIKWAKDKGWDYEIYDEDCDISGNEDAINRPAITRIINDIRAGKLHTIYAREHSRFVRNEKLWQIFVWDYFFPYGVDFQDDDGTDIKTENGRMLAGIKAGQNQNFLPANAIKSMRNKQLNVERGIFRSTPAFGYGIIEKDGHRSTYKKENEANIIKEIFQRSADGEGAIVMTTDLQNRGIRTKRNQYVITSTLIRWIKNPIYKGVLKFNGEEFKSPYEPIVSAELWEKANEGLKVRASLNHVDRRSASNAHLLTGLLHCGYCSDKLDDVGQEYFDHKIYRNFTAGVNHTWSTDRKGKKKRLNYVNYRCQTKSKMKASCCPDGISLKADYIEGEIKSWVQTMIENDYAKTLTKTHTKLEQLQKQITGVKDKLDGLKKRMASINKKYATNELSENDYQDLMSASKEAIAKEESVLNSLVTQVESISGTATDEALKQLGQWDSLTAEQKKNGLLKLFDRIKIYKDKIVISYRATPHQSVTLPIRFVQRKGYQIDADRAVKQLAKNNFIFSKIRI